jgi:putative endopeptidase
MNCRPRKTYLAAAVALLSVGCFAQAPATHHGVDPTAMDTAVKPGDDFYHYANGAWIARTEIPADRTGFSGFSLLADIVNKRVAGIIEEAAKSKAAPGTEKRKMADLYASYMDTAAIDAHGMAALKPHLAEIAAVKTQRELAAALGHTLRADVDALNNTNFHTPNLFGVWVAAGFNDPDHYTPYFMQGGLQLPDRAYYLTDSPRMKDIRDKYVQHIAAMLKLAGDESPTKDFAARAQAILALETAIAQTHISLAEDEDIKKANNPWQMADFA